VGGIEKMPGRETTSRAVESSKKNLAEKTNVSLE
jgi:hypothetical protein